MPARFPALAAALVLGTGAPSAWAQAGIYTCVDAQGRRITADRPITACIDREQRILNRSGTVRETLGPTLTPLEQELQQEQARRRSEERLREREARRREQALLARYPGRAEHDAERMRALDAVEEVIRHARARVQQLQAERAKLEAELAFFRDPARVPPRLQRLMHENQQHLAAQERFLANQEEEKRRIHARFDQELAQLMGLWAARR